MKTILTIILVFTAWLLLVDIEIQFDLIPFGTLILAFLFLISVLILLFRKNNTHLKKMRLVSGVVLILILLTNIILGSINKKNLKVVLHDLRKYQLQHETLPSKIADIKTAGNYYGFKKHDFIYEYDSINNNILIGYNNPIGRGWLYTINKSNLNNTDWIDYDD